ncbi:MAG: hypothetical protein KJO09_10610 [Gammaproteobacteria bacterium]|nr:hypothetical protein [Gammaproteobacteria bacterium]
MHFGKSLYAVILLTPTYFQIPVFAFGDVLLMKNGGRIGSDNKFARLR